MKFNLNKKQMLSIAAVVGVGALVAALILGTNPTKPGAEEPGAEQAQAGHVDGPGGHKEDEKQAEAGHVDGPGGHKEGEKQAEAGHVDGPGGHKEDEKKAEGRVTMSDAQLKQSGVTLLTAGPTRINTTLKMIGEIRLNEDRISHVVPLLMGVITASSANAGDRVRKGQLLAVISSQALADQRSELLAAQKRLALARTTSAREKKLWEEKISAEQDYLQAKNAMQEADIAVQNARQKLASLGGAGGGGSLTRYEIRSPIDGVVVEKHLSLGEAVQGDAKIFVIADLSTVWAEMTVPAKDLSAVRIGQTASIKATAFAAEAGGKVTYVGALVGEQTRAAKARVVLPNPQNLWRPGMQVNVDLVAGTVEVPVAVASQAIQTLDKKTVVFGRSGDYFEARPLELGRTDGKFVEVVSGLNAGEMYAAANSFLIKADLEKSGASHDH